jgi:hypothetical protein
VENEEGMGGGVAGFLGTLNLPWIWNQIQNWELEDRERERKRTICNYYKYIEEFWSIIDTQTLLACLLFGYAFGKQTNRCNWFLKQRQILIIVK